MWSIQVQWRPHSGLDRKRDQSRKSPLAECYRVNKDSSDQQGGAGFSLHRNNKDKEGRLRAPLSRTNRTPPWRKGRHVGWARKAGEEAGYHLTPCVIGRCRTGFSKPRVATGWTQARSAY